MNSMYTSPSAPNQAQPYFGPAHEQQKQQRNSAATTSLILGLVGMVAWLIPIAGYPVTIVGLTKGCKGVSSSKKGIAITGIVLNSFFLLLTLANSVVGVLLMTMN